MSDVESDNFALNSSRQIKKGALMSYITIAFNIIAGLIYTPWMIKQIGKSEYGIFVLVTSLLSYFVIDFGLGNALARYLSLYRSEKNQTKINNLLGLTIKLYLFFDSLIFFALIVVYFLPDFIFPGLTIEEIGKLNVVYIIMGLFSLISFPSMSMNGVLIAYERFVFIKSMELLNKVLAIILMVCALFLGFKLYGLVVVNAIVGLLIILVKLGYLKKTTKIKMNFDFMDKTLMGEILNFSVWSTIIVAAFSLKTNLAPSILAIFSGSAEIAIFGVGLVISGYTETFANALNGLFIPKVTHLVNSENHKSEFNRLMVKVGRIQLILIGAFITGFISLGQEFINLWMGKDFSQSYFVALMLIIPGLVTLTQEIGNTLVVVQNRLKYLGLLYITVSAVSVILSMFFVPKYGAVGSGISIALAVIFVHIIGANMIYLKILKIDMLKFFKECHLSLLLPLVLATLSGFLIQNLFVAPNLIYFLPKIALFSLCYIAFTWLFGMNSEEKLLVTSSFKKLIHR